MKLSFYFVNTNEYSVNLINLSKYTPRTCTLTQSHRLAWLLRTPGYNQRALGVLAI